MGFQENWKFLKYVNGKSSLRATHDISSETAGSFQVKKIIKYFLQSVHKYKVMYAFR